MSCLTFALWLAPFWIPGGTMTTEDVHLMVSSAEAEVGALVRVAVSIDALPDVLVYSYELDIAFDPAILRLEDVEIGATRSEGALVETAERAAGRHRIVAAQREALEGFGPLLHLVFSAVASGASPVEVHLIRFNEGDPTATSTGGLVEVRASSESSPLVVALPDTVVRSGTALQLPVRLAFDGMGPSALDLSMAYDAAVLGPPSVDLAGLPAGAIATFNITTPGLIAVRLALDRPLEAPGTLFTLRFDPPTQPATTQLSVTRLVLDEGGRSWRVEGGRIEIRPARRAGDLTGDGVVDRADALLLFEVLAGHIALDEEQFAAADVSGNGQLSAYDAALILQFAAGRLYCFPAESSCGAGKRGTQHAGTLTWLMPAPETPGIDTAWISLVEGGDPVYSLDLAIPRGALSGERPIDVPDGWEIIRHMRNDTLHVGMAGASPLPSGRLLRVVAPDAGAQGIRYRLNEDSEHRLPEWTGSDEARLDPPYPNPILASATLSYTLPTEGPVRITLFDVLGRRRLVLVDGTQPAGIHQVKVDDHRLAAGTYYATLDFAGRQHVQSLTIR
jgi:hypothetical protein